MASFIWAHYGQQGNMASHDFDGFDWSLEFGELV